MYSLLAENYVEDSEATFRFDYPVEFLRWTLCTPNYNPNFHIGVKAVGDNNKTHKLYGFVSGTPCKAIVRNNTMKMAEINFLCVHKKLREKRLGPTLIKEVTRRVNLTNVWQAYYTSGSVFPHPFATS